MYRTQLATAGLDRTNLVCLRALLTLGDLKLYALALVQGAETVSRNSRVVNEYVRSPAILLDEPETFFGVEPFNCALCHLRASPYWRQSATFNNWLCARAQSATSSAIRFNKVGKCRPQVAPDGQAESVAPPSDQTAEARSAALLEARLRVLANPERAIPEKTYLKSSRDFLGVGLPALRTTVKTWARDEAMSGRDQTLALASELWSSPLFELCLASVELLKFRVKELGPADLAQIEPMIRTSLTWALVDPLATDVVGSIVARYPEREQTGIALDAWATDHDFWVRRAAMLSQLRIVRDRHGDATRFLGYADMMLDEKEFFIRKAIGWVLRDMSRQRPDLVNDWLEPRIKRTSGVTIREAVKYLSPTQREQLLRARLA